MKYSEWYNTITEATEAVGLNDLSKLKESFKEVTDLGSFEKECILYALENGISWRDIPEPRNITPNYEKRIALFQKVSLGQYVDDMKGLGFVEDQSTKYYNLIKIPERATKGSAGYDFFAPFQFTLDPGKSLKIPTGIRVCMNKDWVLKCYPRSGLGFKYRLQVDNTVGIIDSDYYDSDNEGHIFLKVTNDCKNGKTVNVPQGSAFAQGIFVNYGITLDDNCAGLRNGGLGSTGV